MNRAKLAPYEYRRRLPHFQGDDAAVFVTFRTWAFLFLPEPVRDLMVKHCLHDHGTKLHMHAFGVMPDHAHLLFTPLRDDVGDPYSLVEILQSLKGASAHSINKALHRSGPVWSDESFDHVLRLAEKFDTTVEYIRQNPARRGLVSRPEDYRWLWLETRP